MSASRAERLAAAARERELDLLIVSELVNVRWLTGFTGSNGLAILGTAHEGSAGIFLTDFRYVTQVAEQVSPLWDRRQADAGAARPGAGRALPGLGRAVAARGSASTTRA